MTRIVWPLALAVAGWETSSRAAAPRQEPTFKAQAELVVLHVSVRDRSGRYVAGLDASAFTVIDAGRAQRITFFSAEPVPASLAIVVDNSSSMRPNRTRVIAAMEAFVARSDPRDEAVVLAVNEDVRPAFGPAIVGEYAPSVLRAALTRGIFARGMTALYDGVLEALGRVERGRHPRQIVLVVSDGDDNASRASWDDLRARLRDADAVLYAVVVLDRRVNGGNPRRLREMAALTGGEAFTPTDREGVAGAFDRIATDIHNAYTLAYVPAPGPQATTPRHAVQVYVRAPDGRPLRVRARDGYTVPGPQGAP